MLQLRLNEKIVAALHRHWTVFAAKLMGVIVLIILTPIIPLVAKRLNNQEIVAPLALFFTAIYLLIVLLFAFILWINYYFDVWIITTERIIDIEQHSLFRREVSEFSLTKVQDVTVEISGLLPTIFKFGKIIVQTAGEKNFIAYDIPHIYQTKDIILKQAQLVQKNQKPDIIKL